MQKLRHLDKQIKSHFQKYEQSLVLLGARQVGKTTLLKRMFPEATYLLLDNSATKKIFESYDINVYKQAIGTNKTIIIDEIHLLSDPGRAVKILYDQLKDIKLIVTGSSSFHIKNKSSESLAGRKIDYKLYPLTFSEYLFQNNIEENLNFNIINHILKDGRSKAKFFDKSALLESVLTYGLYPETIQLAKDKKYLLNLADSVIFKDIIELDLIDNKSKAKDLLKLLAYQIGNIVSYSEIAQRLGIDQRTVQRYIEIFEQSFILFRLYPYSKNKRSEIGKSPKIYFYDLGLRNAIIDNFDEVNLRPDAGAMFENFIIVEVIKSIGYKDLDYDVNYWRLVTGAEVDLVLSNNKSLIGCEIKLNTGKITTSFKKRYPRAKTLIINSENFY